MQDVFIVGTGATPVRENYTHSLEDLALSALRSALAGVDTPIAPDRLGALYIANAMGEQLAGQANLGAALASAAGLAGIEALRVEGAGASGGLALRQGMLAVASGAYDLVAVLGVEKVTDRLDVHGEQAMAQALDSISEAEHGLTLTAQWAMLMRRYMHEYGYEASAFAPFPVNAHANGAGNAGALYRFPINGDKYTRAAQVASPLNMLDCSTLADGAAAVLLASPGLARELSTQAVRLAGSAVATDTLALYDRPQPLHLAAAQRSSAAALQQAGLGLDAVQVLDVSDPHGIVATLALEAIGCAEPGSAPRHAADGGIAPTGATPLATAGGYKARGDVGGANGVYQVVELVRHLHGQAGKAQVPGARVALAQCLGGVGSTVVTHVLVGSEA